MNRIIAVVSGKGGVGKTTLCCHLGRALAARGERTAIVELDCGLRGLDIMLGISDTVYDLDDILAGRGSLEDALVSPADQPLLSLLPAPAKFRRFPDESELRLLCGALSTRYQNVLLDVSAGCAMAQQSAAVATDILLVVNPDPICVRDAALFADYLRVDCQTEARMRLIIARVRRETIRKGMVDNLDEVIDRTGVQLIGVLPESPEIYINTAKGLPLRPEGLPARVFTAIAARLEGESRPLLVR